MRMTSHNIKESVTKLLFVILLSGFVSCIALHPYRSAVVSGNAYHSSYDDTTLTVNNSSILMPYNRFIDPAGSIIRYGNLSGESHSLDCTVLPGGKTLVVEDHNGLAFIDTQNKKLIFHLDYVGPYKDLLGTYSGLKAAEIKDSLHIFWSVSNPSTDKSFVLDALWDGKRAHIVDSIPFKCVDPSPLALPNDLFLNTEKGEIYIYVVLNGNSQLAKLRLSDKKETWTTQTGMAPFGIVITSTKAYVSNWAGYVPTDKSKETAGIPYGSVYIDPRTGATSSGTVSVVDLKTGKILSEIQVGLHPNAIITDKDQKYVYVANGNSDNVSVISTESDKLIDSISVRLLDKKYNYIGDSPNGLALNSSGDRLYVSNGMDNAIAVVRLGANVSGSGKGKSCLEGFIPTEAYPSGLALADNTLYVANLEGEGARTASDKRFMSHLQEATVSIIPLPDEATLNSYTSRVEASNMVFRARVTQRMPRRGIAPRPVPERIGEPSVFRHVIYIIKENKTYDQVMGDMSSGDGMPSLCIYGNDVTPNQHKLARDFMLLDNYYASGKCSAEGHSWTDAAIVTDYVEKNVRVWFRSYPHVLADALVYNKEGFIWNNALDHGKTVKIYGEACTLKWNEESSWQKKYHDYLDGKPADFENETTISRIRPVLSQTYPGYDGPACPDQIRAGAFIKELEQYETMPGDQLPQLMILALPADHTVGMREGHPTPRAMIADNDLALGKIIEALTKSKFWSSTVVFVTEDDSQTGWDHVSAYRTTGFVISPYSHLRKTVHTNYNQTCIVRTIEQILGIPPMNVIDATALPMFDCFNDSADSSFYENMPNIIPLDEMNKSTATLTGKARKYSELSNSHQYDNIDNGDDDLLNHILWYMAKGDIPYPRQMTLPKKERKDDDD
jgi:YVTN family beta-propeller protein